MGDEAGADAQRPHEQSAPRVVRRIVCAYRLGFLPGDWLQTWRRLDRLLVREGFKVKALLEPLEDLPSDADLVVAAPELGEAAEAVVPPGVPLLLTTPSNAAAEFAALVQRLKDGTELTAERIGPSDSDGPTIVTYRGGCGLTDLPVPSAAGGPPTPVRGPMHPVTRIGRVLQQVRSFTILHASELEGLALELEAAGQGELAARLRVFQGLHSQEAGFILDELADVQADLDRAADDGSTAAIGPSEIAAEPVVDAGPVDPAANSPKRARWLAEQARQAEEDRRPRSRRDLFKRG